jgi:general stress protein 26
MDGTSFDDIADDFHKRVARIVWCSVATVDAKSRPRQRILHPIWEGATGWIATGRHSHKEKHLAKNPYVALSYWDQQHEQIYIEAKAQWVDDVVEKRRLWELYKSTPPPLGYDLQMIWQGGVDDPTYGLLKLTPWRIELFALNDMFVGKQPQVWKA